MNAVLNQLLPLSLHCCTCDKVFIVNFITFKKKQITKKQEGRRRGDGHTSLLVSSLTVTVITDTCLKSDSSAKHSEALNSHWAVGTPNKWRSKIHPSHWGAVTIHLPSVIFCGKTLGGQLPVGPAGFRSGKDSRDGALLPSVTQRRRALTLSCSASLVLGPLLGGPAIVRPLFGAGTSRGMKENKKMSHLTKDLDFPRLHDEHLQPPHPPAPQGNWRSRGEIHVP